MCCFFLRWARNFISFVLMQKNNYLCKKSKQIWNRKNKMLTEDVK